MRLLIVFLLLLSAFAVPFLLFGEDFDQWLAGEAALAWLRARGDWAWALAVLLLVGDLVLPVPATAVMAALGMLYGPLLGGLIGGAGSILSGLVAYGACRLAGRGAARFLAGERDLERGERFFARAGGWAVVISRWMPLLPEVVACMAGMVLMPAGRFTAALACGSVPMALVFAHVGHAGVGKPLLALAASALIPLLLWLPISRWGRR